MIQGLPERLKQLRTQNHYSQKELSSLLNLSPSVISGYETGEKTPSTEVLLKLTGLYHCSSDFLLGISCKQEANLIDVTGLTSEQVKALHILINAIKKGQQ